MLQGKLTTGGTLSGVLSGSIKEPALTTKNITENGTYNASSDNVDGYSQVNVDVEPSLSTKNITENGTYNASSDNVDGYSQVNVNVSGGGTNMDYSSYSGTINVVTTYRTAETLNLSAGYYIINAYITGSLANRKYLKITTDDADTSDNDAVLSYGTTTSIPFGVNFTRIFKFTEPTTVYVKCRHATLNTNFDYKVEVLKFT